MRPAVKRIVIGLCIVLLAGLGAIAWHVRPIHHKFYSDADTIKEPAKTAVIRDILWQPAVKLSELVNTGSDDYEPRLSADGMTLYFVRGKAGHDADIYLAWRTPAGWTDPQPLSAVNSKYDELGPEPSADGLSLYFYSDRPGGSGGYDIWVAYRRQPNGLDFSEPINLGPLVNSEFNDYGPSLTPDAATLYFSSNRPQGDGADEPNPDAWPATLREDLYHRDYDLYVASITERGFGAALPLTNLNTPYNEGAPAVTPVGDFVYFSSDRPGGEGGFDLYRSRRLQGEQQQPTNLGAGVNTAANELDPGMSLGGFGLHFSSDRLVDAEKPRTDTKEQQQKDYDLYYAASREVFTEVDVARASINWGALWAEIAPNLLWLLLALLLLLLLLFLVQGAKDRRFSLLAKCVLASLFAHLLLMFLMNFWEVTATLADAFRHRGGIQIALVSTARADDIAAQIRGDLTEIDAPSPVEFSAERQTTPLEMQSTETMADLTVNRDSREWIDESVVETTPDDAPSRQLDAPEPIAAFAQLDPPIPLDISTPPEPARAQADERDSSADITPAETTLQDRPRPAVEVARQAQRDSQVDLAPERLNTPDAQEMSASLVQPATARQAAPQAPKTVESSAFRFARQELVQVADLSLPSEPQRTQDAETRDVAESVPPSDLPHSRPPLNADAIQHIEPTTPVTLAPQSVGHDDPRATAESVALVTPAQDVTPNVGVVQMSNVDTAFIERPSAHNLELPLLVESQSAQTEEGPLQITAARVDLPRSEMANAVGSSLAVRTTVEIEPGAIAEQRNEPTMAAKSAELAKEANWVGPLLDVVPMSFVGSLATPRSDMTLPLLEESSVARRAEASPQLRAAASDVARPSASSYLSQDDSETRVEWFAPSASPSSETQSLAGLSHPNWRTESLVATLAIPTLAAVDTDPQRTALRLPTDFAPPTEEFAQRSPEQRQEVLESLGGSNETERAVASALKWLAEHQSDDGRWDSDAFDEQCGECGGQTQVRADKALTGLSLLCFLGAGSTHTRDGPYRDTVARGLRWLLAQQEPDGDLRVDETMYSHGIATIALSEAYGMTGDSGLADAVERAVGFIVRTRNRHGGGWRYDPGQFGDTSVLGWLAMALRSAEMAGLDVPSVAYDTARSWLRRVEHRRRPGQYGYQPGNQPTRSMTAEGMFTQVLLGLPRSDPRMRGSADYITEHLPDWESDASTYYWYYATLALFHYQGDRWDDWNASLTDQLLTHQRRDGRAAGSWDPVDKWSSLGGRVYQTALCALMLEVYYRYLPLYALDGEEPVDTFGTIRGRVTDAATGKPLPGAVVRLDLPDRSAVTATADGAGLYELHVPEVPEFFALSAAYDDYLPATVNLESARLEDRTVTQDFDLQPKRIDIVAIENTPQVHHLGNDAFEGSINSQFQKKSEGESFSAEFELTIDQLPPHFNSARVQLLAKGVQCPHVIHINGELIDAEMDESPSDGSFGGFSAPLDMSLLREGTNTIMIRAKRCRGDLDDFEFVNLQIHFSP